MTINVAAGAAAYANAAKTLTASQGAGVTSGQGFGDLLKSTLEGAVNDQQKGEAASMQAVAGNADINSVVAAVTNADVTLQTVVAVRDKVVSAYQEILHMTV
jgi:flagellar hook-basal body complex protein FliE